MKYEKQRHCFLSLLWVAVPEMVEHLLIGRLVVQSLVAAVFIFFFQSVHHSLLRITG